MTANKQTVQKFMDAVSKANHVDVLSCLTDDVEWVVPGVIHTRGKDDFDKQINGDVSCTISVTRMIEENNVVIAEGCVQTVNLDGSLRQTIFCDVFVFQDAKIKHLTAYLMEVNK